MTDWDKFIVWVKTGDRDDPAFEAWLSNNYLEYLGHCTNNGIVVVESRDRFDTTFRDAARRELGYD